jgi:hypothetical protein
MFLFSGEFKTDYQSWSAGSGAMGRGKHNEHAGRYPGMGLD